MKAPAAAAVCLAIGVLLGHFAWPPQKKSSRPRTPRKAPAEENTPAPISQGTAAKPHAEDSPAKPLDAALVAMELAPLTMNPAQDGQMLLLRDKDGKREVPIYVGNYEAEAIDRALKKVQIPRPLTHDLLQNVIVSMGGKLEKVVLTELRGDTFCANLVISFGAKQANVDARPSDGIALAVRCNAPIFAANTMLIEAAEHQQRDIERLKKKDAEKQESQPKKADF